MIQGITTPSMYIRPPLGLRAVSVTVAMAVAFVGGSYAQTYFPPVPIDGAPNDDTVTQAVSFVGGTYKQTYGL